jgi:hypothetical protein
MDDLMIRILWLTLSACLLPYSADGQVSELQRRHEKSDIAKLSRITREDHSTIFFTGLTDAGYIRDGQVYSVVLEHCDRRSDFNYGRGDAVSRDGTRIVYATAAGTGDSCEIVLRDLRTGGETRLALIEKSARLFSWSWDDKELAYQGKNAIVAISVADGSKRVLGRLPLRINGTVPTEGWNLLEINWLHHRPELVIDVDVRIPTHEPGTSVGQDQTLLFSRDDSRILTVGSVAAASPTDDRIAYIDHGHVFVINADGSNRRTVASLPPTLPFLLFLRESPWSTIVWSPTGDRLWFNTIIDEGGNTNVYLVDVTTGRRRRVLKHTLITVTAWRPSSPIPEKR